MADELFLQDFVTFNGYPYWEDVPDAVSNEPPYLTAFFKQDFTTFNGYPYFEGMPDIVLNEPPYPDSLFKQDFVTFNGYPHWEKIPEKVDYGKRPLPYVFFKPNYAKKTYHKITVPCCKPETIIMREHKQRLISI